ncbi:signal transduction histidine kinase [Streptomyces sp. 846.5]|nr:HAMP domain-containing sensor histidine kinase [Streptomyces sp. 846.5]TDT95504.1 signal transduction histidine kinase [Streptomyces sp. 846.5]
MDRRIALSVLALVTVLLALAVVPLAWLLGAREQTSFRADAEASGRTVASVAEEHLNDHKSDAPMLALLARTQAEGDCAAVYDSTAAVIARTSCGTATRAGVRPLVVAALHDARTHLRESGGVLTVATPIGETEDSVGVAVLTRSAAPLHNRIAAVWGWLALIGLVTLLAGAAVSVALARWVSRPLHAVDRAARQLGEGSLEVRAPVGDGPPEVRRLAATFNTMAARNETLVHGHRTVIADVSHQLRTPLTALRLRLDLLAGDVDQDAALELAGAQEEIARLSRLVGGLLAVARAESAVPAPVRVAVDVVVAERVTAWEPVAAERQVSLGCRCEPGVEAFLGPDDLEQVLDNLIANALDAAREGGRVRLDGGRAGAAVRVSVVDDGPGMSTAARAAAFRRFGNPEARGSGLGLAIVHRLVTANGGTARLEDTPGGGLTVVLGLPAAPPAP